MSTATPRKYAALTIDPEQDADMCAMLPDDQLLYTHILREPLLSKVGVGHIKLGRWADWAQGRTRRSVEESLERLAAERFVLLDWRNEMLLVRTYLRHDNSLANWKHAQSVISAFKQVINDDFKRAIAVELNRIDPETICTGESEKTEDHRLSVRAQVLDLMAEWLPTDHQSFAIPVVNPLPIGMATAQPATSNQQPSTPNLQTPAAPAPKASTAIDGHTNTDAAAALIKELMDNGARAERQASNLPVITDNEITVMCRVITQQLADGFSPEAIRASADGALRSGIYPAKYIAKTTPLKATAPSSGPAGSRSTGSTGSPYGGAVAGMRRAPSRLSNAS